MEYKTISTDQLQPFPMRDIRESVIAKLKERIADGGYNPARPISVIEADGGYIVADGNHRLRVANDEGINELPCIVYHDADPYTIGTKANQDEDTYAPMDLFDWLDVVKRLKDEGHTQEQIGEKIGWSRGAVSQYIMLSKEIATPVLELAKENQLGRVAKCATHVAHEFTEGWFRTSGLYDISEKYQLRLFESFKADKFNWNKSKVQAESAKYKRWQEMIDVANAKLANGDDLQTVIDLVERGTFKTTEQLNVKIADLNKKASNKLICGDAVQVLEELEDGSVDLVITDPPYGMDYKSNFGKYKDGVAKSGVANDRMDEAVELFKKTVEILSRKTKENAHLYFFINWSNFHIFREIASEYFNIKTPLVWYKTDAGIGDLEGDWINGTEVVLFCTKGNKKVNKRRVNVLNVKRLHSSEMIHPTQKPVEVIKQILEVSAVTADTMVDPFMGSGSHIKAAREYGELSYIGIELDNDIFEKAKSFIGGE